MKMEERVETIDQMTEKPTTPSKYEGLEAAMTAELMIGFWFGIGEFTNSRKPNSQN